MKTINEAMKVLQENKKSLSEERIYRALQKGDVYINSNGITLTVLDVDNEHKVNGQPQVIIKFSNDNDTKCFPMYGVSQMLYHNGYTKMDENKENNINEGTSNNIIRRKSADEYFSDFDAYIDKIKKCKSEKEFIDNNKSYISDKCDLSDTEAIDACKLIFQWGASEIRDSRMPNPSNTINIDESRETCKNKVIKEDYTAREEFDAALKRYLSNGENRSADDIKVVAETDNYLLTASRDSDKPERIHLSIFSGSERSVNVYIDQDYRGKVEKAEVNWSAIGSVSPDEAEAYCKRIMAAVEFAREIDGKDYSSKI